MSPHPLAATYGSGACRTGLGDVHEAGPLVRLEFTERAQKKERSLAKKKRSWSEGA